MPATDRRAAAIVLTGGASRRMGTDKTVLRLGDSGGSGGPDDPDGSGGRTLLERVLDALTGAAVTPIVVVGPPSPITDSRPTLISVTESTPGGGPAHALATGLAQIPGGIVLLLAADLPFLTAEAVMALVTALSTADPHRPVDGAVYTDGTRPQWLCGAWRVDALRKAVAATGAAPGTPLRALLAPLAREELTWTAPGPPPYFDCDTPEALAEAERILSTRDAWKARP
ncbi:molybdenum cofactor guanylyltransferase [Actinorhabdospora filicis]|uniref:molybdenum cofactor guanylyltransferase n=1 Tax=Actinorhabdospora filicis TaxID=1785913 RepID=UPI0025556B78|nr:molybdenum cofactor guanylyltransferase [Actinorhabdospora filicis]